MLLFSLQLNPAELSDEEMKILFDTPNKQNLLSPREKSKSTVAALVDPIPQGLWRAITEGEDKAGRWHLYTFGQENARQFCDVLYLSECVAEEKCEEACRSRGAGKYRWFPNGCCECVDQECQGYGSQDTRCKICDSGQDKQS